MGDHQSVWALVIGEFESRQQTTASTFKPKLWTYAETSPTIENGGG
ncbi:hypothetical protein H4S14_000712 [Agrobacterium vitis]|nr:hypothetical protein [Agrobacterium vitis]MBE1436985.1 hypothetical protein [Agrobacterium vitis]